MLGQLLQGALDLVFPPRCSGCDRIGWRWCDICQQALVDVPLDVVQRRMSGLRAFASTGEHSGTLRDAMRALKYNGAQAVAVPLAQRLINVLDAQSWRFDMVIPVPLHRGRATERGYNQAKALAVVVAAHYDRALKDTVVMRKRSTRTQVGLTYQQRIDNVAGAFVTTEALHGHAVLLIDDVRTTGATLSACAQALQRAGADPIYGITVTHATLRQHR